MSALQTWKILLAISFSTIYGAYYIVLRHRIYIFYRSELAKLVKEERDIPEFIKKPPEDLKTKLVSLSGVIFYVLWSVGIASFSVIAYWN